MSEPKLYLLGRDHYAVIHHNDHGKKVTYHTNSLRKAEEYLDQLERQQPKIHKKPTLIQWFIQWMCK